MNLPCLITLLVVSSFFQISTGDQYEWYKNCSELFTCGKLKAVGFPFWGGDKRLKGCGYPHLELHCKDDLQTTIIINKMEFVITNINVLDRVIHLARKDYENDSTCVTSLTNTSVHSGNFFQYAPGTMNLTVLYGCKRPKTHQPGEFTCKVKGAKETFGYYVSGAVGPITYGCYASVVIPIPETMEAQLLFKGLSGVLHEGFELNYTLLNDDDSFCKNCQSEPSYGYCAYNLQENKTVCLCEFGSEGKKCKSNISSSQTPPSAKTGKKRSKMPLIIGLCVSGAVATIVVAVCIIIAVKRAHSEAHADLSNQASTHQLDQQSPPRPSPVSILEDATSLGLTLFSYSELEEATQNFKTELGDGAYTTVYQGRLRDGREVAVKVLSEINHRRKEQFLNEVNSLARLIHPNLVKLYGCTPRENKDLLIVLEFVSNGTLEEHLHGNLAISSKLSWATRIRIVVQTADALLYLHLNRVVHRDVKTTNILLDEKFQAKVADFGLARIFPRNASHVLTDAQGTPGYVDPQYYETSRLTEKSDVYSFGVVLVELISSKIALDIGRPSKDVILANMALDRIPKDAICDLVDPTLGYGVDQAVTKMIDAVAQLAFRCLNKEDKLRPTMEEVLNCLKDLHPETNVYSSEASASGHASTSNS